MAFFGQFIKFWFHLRLTWGQLAAQIISHLTKGTPPGDAHHYTAGGHQCFDVLNEVYFFSLSERRSSSIILSPQRIHALRCSPYLYTLPLSLFSIYTRAKLRISLNTWNWNDKSPAQNRIRLFWMNLKQSENYPTPRGAKRAVLSWGTHSTIAGWRGSRSPPCRPGAKSTPPTCHGRRPNRADEFQ